MNKPAYVVNLKGSDDTPEKIVKKINSLTYAIEPHAINGEFVSKKEFESLKSVLDKTFKGVEDRVNYNIEHGRKKLSDMRWHGGGSSSAGSSSGYQQVQSGVVNGINTSFTWATAPNVIVVDTGRVIRKVSSDGTINWTGTTTTILSVPPNFDIFAIA